jgi:predicted DNA-binding transcriptional regulator AlpA
VAFFNLWLLDVKRGAMPRNTIVPNRPADPAVEAAAAGRVVKRKRRSTQRKRRRNHRPQTARAPPRLLTREDLAARGIHYGRSQLRRMWQRGDFPVPKRLSPHKLVWLEPEIDAWIVQRLGA